MKTKNYLKAFKTVMMIAAVSTMGFFSSCSKSNDDHLAATTPKSGTVTMTCLVKKELIKYADIKFVYTENGVQKSAVINQSDWKQAPENQTADYIATKSIEINSFPYIINDANISITPKDSTTLTIEKPEGNMIFFGAAFNISAQTKDANSNILGKDGEGDYDIKIERGIGYGPDLTFRALFATMESLINYINQKTYSINIWQDGRVV